ncbi:MAG: hypothetical protein ACC645_21495 [Pirellulales bacterium]
MIQRRKPANGEAFQRKGDVRKPWRHPRKRSIKVPHRAAAAIAVMEMGVSDYSVIATAVGLTVEEVRRIDMAEDSPIRELGSEGIPYGEYFTLEKVIRCPKCHAMVRFAPCVACDGPPKYRSAQRRGYL